MTATISPDALPLVDLRRADAAGLALAPEAASLLFRDARTPSTFTAEPVTDEQMRAVYDLVKWAPTALNSQPLRVVLVRSDEARARLLPLMSGTNADRVASAPLVAILAADLDWHDELPRVMPAYAGARERFADQQEARREAALHNASIQAGYFILGVRAAGLDAGPMGGFDHAAVAREFFPGGAHEALMVVNVGHAASDAFRPRNPRLDYEDVFRAA